MPVWRSDTTPGPGSAGEGRSRVSFDFPALGRLNVHCHLLASQGTFANCLGFDGNPPGTPQGLVVAVFDIGDQLPQDEPRTTLNVGQISGGTSINSIPESAT